MGLSKPTIGVVTISYNQHRFLEEAITSVQVSDRTRLRYVIVDPGSTDGSRDIIARHRSCFSATVLEKDRGPTDGLNKGFAACDAAILGYINADDRLEPGALDWVLGYFEQHPDVDVVAGAIRILDEDGNVEYRRRMPWRLTPQDIVDGTCTYVQQGTFMRRSAWERTRGFNPDNRTCWDTELMVDLMLAGCRIRVAPVVLGAFRIYSTSICGQQLIGGSTALTNRRAVEHSAMVERITQTGCVRSSGARLTARKLAAKYSPMRRLYEMTARAPARVPGPRENANG